MTTSECLSLPQSASLTPLTRPGSSVASRHLPTLWGVTLTEEALEASDNIEQERRNPQWRQPALPSEIIAISRKIGTFETSIEPYEDCCTIFTPPHPKTSPTMEEILAAEAGMPDLLALEAEAAENVEKIYIRMGGEEDDLL